MMHGMKLQDITTQELRETIKATERLAGRDSPSAKLLRRALQLRLTKGETAKAVQHG